MRTPFRVSPKLLLAAALLSATAPAAVLSQDGQTPSQDMAAMMEAWQAAMTPGPMHELLAAGAGTWSLTMTVYGPPDTPPEVHQGTVERRLDLDGRIRVDRLTSEMMGMPLEGIATTGFDNVTGRFWATWTDNMSTSVSVLWGEMDESGGTLEGDYSEPMTGERAPMRIETTMVGPDRQIDTFYMPGPEGSMVETMEVVYERN